MKRLRPSATAGAPGSVAPMTSKSGADRCARYQVEGTRVPRCGSLASSGFPEAVSVPSTTQLFEPSASVLPPRRRKSRASGTPPDNAAAQAAEVDCVPPSLAVATAGFGPSTGCAPSRAPSRDGEALVPDEFLASPLDV